MRDEIGRGAGEHDPAAVLAWLVDLGAGARSAEMLINGVETAADRGVVRFFDHEK